ncbi:MAG TPA: hypothetical protein VMJ30_03625 [Gemmatimonadales bacterium]|nr:hypothetical protein [Gemmatimonadales bacterium]
MHGDDDQIVPYAESGPVRAARAERDTEDIQVIPHGMPTTEAETINADLLAFVQS